MNPYEAQLLARYRHADLLAEADHARLAKIAQSHRQPTRQRVGPVIMRGPVRAFAGWLRGAAATAPAVPSSPAAAGGSVSGHALLRPAR